MSLLINLRHLARKNLELRGEITVDELDLDDRDKIVRLPHPAQYHVIVERPGPAVLAQGTLEATMSCICVRCLREFERKLLIDNWLCEVFPGDEETPVQNDSVIQTVGGGRAEWP